MSIKSNTQKYQRYLELPVRNRDWPTSHSLFRGAGGDKTQEAPADRGRWSGVGRACPRVGRGPVRKLTLCTNDTWPHEG
jgi:hypothetical protein